MSIKKPIFSAIEDYIQNYPIQLQISCHNGKTAAQTQLNDLIKAHGIKKVDGAWECMMNIEGLAFNGYRLGDLGEQFHQVFNSKLCLFMQNGSSMGNQIVALSLAHKKVLIQANSHVSVYNGLSLANAEIVLVEPQFNCEYYIHMPINAQQVQDAIQLHPDIYAIYLTSPSYEGLVANYSKIKQVIGKRLLIVDEAHGAIHYFNKNMPSPALNSGADITICSMHKSLGTLVGTSLLNVGVNSKVSIKKILDCYYTFASTSPNLIMLASVFDAITQLQQTGEGLITNTIQLNKSFRNNISKLNNVFIDSFEEDQMDPMKTLFGIKNLSGQKLSDLLSATYNIAIEKSTDKSVIVTIHINSSAQDIQKLTQAVTEIAQKYEKQGLLRTIKAELPLYVEITKKRNIQLALSKVIASEKEEKEIKDCIGRISGSLQFTCPPGYPILVFGEQILEEHVQLLGQNFLIEVVVED